MFAGETGIVELHDGVVDFLYLLAWGVGGRYDLRNNSCQPAGAHEFVDPARPVLPLIFPVIVHRARSGVVEQHAVRKTMHGRHVLLLGNGLDMVDVHRVHILRLRIFDFNALRQQSRIGDGGLHAAAVIVDEFVFSRQKFVMPRAHIERQLHVPLRRDDQMIVVRQHIAIFENTADLDVGKGENLGLILQRLALLENFFVRLPGKGNYGPVAVNCPALNGADREAATLIVIQFHIAIVHALFCEDFESNIEGVNV